MIYIILDPKTCFIHMVTMDEALADQAMAEAYKLRGDSDTEAKIFRFMSEMIEYYRNMSCEYGYIWRDGKWECYALEPQEIDLSTMESFANV